MISTAGDLINFCFRVSGINGQGQTSSAEDSADALVTLAAMVGQWQRKRWLTWSLTETAVVSTGANSYTIGATGAFAVPRPDRIESAFVRYVASSPSVDVPLGIIESAEDYATIAIKTLPGWAAGGGLFYESSFPLGVLHFWPVTPATQFELHIFTKAALPVFAALTDAISLPPEYIEALKYNLVVRLAADWGMEPKPAHVKLAMAGLNTIRTANTQIPTQRMPGDLPGRARHNGTNMAAFISGRW
jgi:hypothetical protein